ncbi:MAG: pilus assembly protein PilB, partial [Planctomycetota bacterium]
EELLLELGADSERMRGATFFYGKGCDTCHHTGYKGRSGIFEIMAIDDEIRRAVVERESSDKIRNYARSSGMRSLRESGLRAVTEGRTTIEEVLRETSL